MNAIMAGFRENLLQIKFHPKVLFHCILLLIIMTLAGVIVYPLMFVILIFVSALDSADHDIDLLLPLTEREYRLRTFGKVFFRILFVMLGLILNVTAGLLWNHGGFLYYVNTSPSRTGSMIFLAIIFSVYFLLSVKSGDRKKKGGKRNGNFSGDLTVYCGIGGIVFYVISFLHGTSVFDIFLNYSGSNALTEWIISIISAALFLVRIFAILFEGGRSHESRN